MSKHYKPQADFSRNAHFKYLGFKFGHSLKKMRYPGNFQISGLSKVEINRVYIFVIYSTLQL